LPQHSNIPCPVTGHGYNRWFSNLRDKDKIMKYGLIGCGGIGDLRAEALGKTGGQTLVAVCDSDPARAQTVSGKHGGRIIEDWQDLIRQDDIDAVIVSTPPSLHMEMTIAALAAGKHVLCEKPLARNLSECQAMIDAAKQHGRVLATGFNYRFYPSILKARELFDSGIIGELDHVRSYTGYSATAHDHEWLHEFDTMGGGTLRDNGIHLIDLTTWFLGDVIDITGMASGSVWNFPGCEDNGFALLRNSKGNIASLQSSWNEWRGYRLLVEIYGTLGCIRAWCFPMLTQVVWSTERGGPVKRKTHLFAKTHIMEKLKTYRWVVVDSFVHEFAAFADAVNGKPSAIASGEDGMLTIRIADEATRSARS
jgi:predicted dehydrogenase